MATQVQYRRGTSAQNDAFTGALGEITVDTTNWVLRVADGVTSGGYTMVGLNATQTLANKTYNGVSVSVTGNITGGNVIFGSGQVSGTGNITGGNLSVGTGAVSVGSIVNNNANATGNIGSSTKYFNTVFAQATSAQYADVAEKYVSDHAYPPGTVLNFGGNNEVTIASSSHSTSIAGVVSTNPAYIMNAGAQGEAVVEVALLGRVPCNVVGTINKGDRLVSSNIPGVAQVLDSNFYQPGCIIGKALENYNSDQVGKIEVVIGRV